MAVVEAPTKTPASLLTPLRQYFIVSGVLLVGYVLLRDSDWVSGSQLHTVVEVAATALALVVGAMALVRYYTGRDAIFLLVGTGFLATGFLDAYHAVVTSSIFPMLMPSTLPSLIPWSWSASRTFLALVLFFSWLAWKSYAQQGHPLPVTETTVYALGALFTGVFFAFFAFVPLPPAYFPEQMLGRPQELIAAVFFGAALVGYVRKGSWRDGGFEHWLVLSLIVGLLVQVPYMTSSFQLFDAMFDGAHQLKIFSYLFVLVGLLHSMHRAFEDVDSQLLQLEDRQNELLSAQEQLRRQSAELDVYFEKSVTGMAITSLDKGWLRVNTALTRMFGYTLAEFRELSWAAMTHPDDLALDVAEFDKLAAGEIDSYQLEKRFYRKDGTVLHSLVSVAAARNSRGEIDFFMAQIVDVGDAVEARELLKEERLQLTSLFSGIDEVIYVADPESYELLYVNDAFRQNWSVEGDLAKRKCYQVLQGRDSPCPFCTNDKIFGENLGKTYRWEFQNEENQRWYSIADKAIRWTDGRPVRFEIASDITDQKQAGEERLRLEKFSALGRLTAGVAHEMNNPLMGVINYAQFCMEETDPADERYEVLGDIERETRRCIDVVRNLLAFSRSSATTFGAFEALDTVEVVEQVLRLLDYRIRKHNVAVTVDASAARPHPVLRRESFQQVYLNLVGNAIDAMVQCDDRRLITRLYWDHETFVLEVTDSGSGMTEETRSQMFDPFFTTKARGEGTGLGLSTCLALVDDEGGEIHCSSRLGKGTTIGVRWRDARERAESEHG